jgi:hypothetical protein
MGVSKRAGLAICRLTLAIYYLLLLFSDERL